MSTSEAVTRGVRVEVRSHYSPEHSRPQAHQWFFLYTIRISNEGDETVQLLSRHWIITDADSAVLATHLLGCAACRAYARDSAEIDDALNHPVDTLVTYDPNLGIPLDVQLDLEAIAVDGGLSLTVSDFERLD